jgi:hypothetical protein
LIDLSGSIGALGLNDVTSNQLMLQHPSGAPQNQHQHQHQGATASMGAPFGSGPSPPSILPSAAAKRRPVVGVTPSPLPSASSMAGLPSMSAVGHPMSMNNNNNNGGSLTGGVHSNNSHVNIINGNGSSDSLMVQSAAAAVAAAHAAAAAAAAAAASKGNVHAPSKLPSYNL